MLSVLAFTAYLLAGMHLACADLPAVVHSEACMTTSACDEGGTHTHQVLGHCHAAHMHILDAASPIVAPSLTTTTRPASPPNQIMASVDPSGPERPPRT